MDLNQILSQYDSMFGKNSLLEIEEYLVDVITEAKEKSERGILVTLLNEIIGFYRDTTQKEKALHYCEQLQQILKEMQLEGRIDYATSLLNVANAYRQFGLFKESLDLYRIVETTYKGQVSQNDFMYASLYNNWSLLYQEMGDFEAARDMLKKALVIADSYEEAVIPQATTRTNLAATLLQIRTKEAYQEAVFYLQEALAVFEKDGGRDFHYGAALVAMGDAYCFQKEYEKAVPYYEKGLAELEKHVGKTDNYARVMEKYQFAKKQIMDSEILQEKSGEHGQGGETWISNLERSRAFYENYGKEMIHKKFPEYENRIAVGLVGEGSDCFGFDDAISTDHDYEMGFCMWLNETDYEKIGDKLQAEYENLVCEHVKKDSQDLFLYNRRGVFSINGFYDNLLGTALDYEETAKEEENGRSFDKQMPNFWEKMEEHQLAAAVNGEVFYDDFGIFTTVRKQLMDYYPEMVWRKKLAQSLHDFSQYAQSNYPRMMARKDVVTSRLCVAKAIEAAMDLVYLLRQEFAPYYKWKKKGLEKMALRRDVFPLVQEILPLLEKAAVLPVQTKAWEKAEYSSALVNENDECVAAFEEMAACILQEMIRQGLTDGDDLFLENHIRSILRGKNMDLVEAIVQLEWKQFDKVQNEGGRAGCQDDYQTFSIMRKSQYMTWPEELLSSFYGDLVTAENKGWNLIMEKYARMMKSTTPEKYARLERELPALNEERIAIQEEIIRIQVGWMEEFAEKYPNMAGNARVIHTSEDTPFQTSYETYLRGEMSTYSETTFILYGKFITGLLKENRNLAYETMEHTAKLYGYETIEKAEKALG